MSEKKDLVVKLFSHEISPPIPRRSKRLATKKIEPHVYKTCNDKENSRLLKNTVLRLEKKEIGVFGNHIFQKKSGDRQHFSNITLNKLTNKSKVYVSNTRNGTSTSLEKRNTKSSQNIVSNNFAKDSTNSERYKLQSVSTHSKSSSKVFVDSTHNSAKLNSYKHLHNNDSFEEYGLLLPSFENILENKAAMESEARALDTYDELYGDLDITFPFELRDILNMSDSPQKSDLLDCEHLSMEELRTYFYKNIIYVRNILEGKIYSVRHEKFMNMDPTYDFTYCISTVIYTQEQQDHLLMLLEENFDSKEKNNTQYFFNVLLPEVCLKIFMDVHNKTFEEAVRYLEWRPVE